MLVETIKTLQSIFASAFVEALQLKMSSMPSTQGGASQGNVDSSFGSPATAASADPSTHLGALAGRPQPAQSSPILPQSQAAVPSAVSRATPSPGLVSPFSPSATTDVPQQVVPVMTGRLSTASPATQQVPQAPAGVPVAPVTPAGNQQELVDVDADGFDVDDVSDTNAAGQAEVFEDRRD
jgi:hypothetical protein